MRKRVLSLFLVLVMTLGLAAPVSAAKDDRSDLPEYEILSALPEKLDRPTRPTTLQQADLYSHPAGGGNLVKWTDENTLQEIVELTDSLTAGKTTDTQKMKAIFEWVYQNINYGHEDNTLWGKRFSDLTQEQRKRLWEAGDPYSVYTKRLGICEGYSNLCWLMGTIAGIPVAKLTCYTSMGHARNAALLDGRWVFFDATEAWNTVDPDYSWDLDPYERASSYSAICFYDGVYQMYVARGYEKNIIVSAAFRSGFQCPANVTIPSYATEVSRSAFKGCTDLKSVTIPNGVTTIDGNAFEGCTNLENVDIPNSVTTIAGGVFYGCTGLKSITIPGSVSEISSILFKDCTSLESVTIFDGVTRIWQEAFAGCTSLKSITIPGSITNMEGAFYECTALESVTIERGVTSIGFSTFMGCTSLTDITIPNTVTTIEDQAFWNCTSLERVIIPEGVTSIGKLAFAECENLKYADLPDSVSSVDGSAFFGCPNLQGMTTIPASMTTIAVGAFQDRTDLTSFVIPDHVTDIGSRAFYGCSNLQSITIPEGVTNIGAWSFYGCTSLTDITIPSSVTTIEFYAFAGCTGLTSMNIPEGVTSIGDSATPYTLSYITIPASVTSIGRYVIGGGGMTDVYYAGTEAQWKAITIGEPSFLDRVTIHYNSTGPKPTAVGTNTAYASTQSVLVDGRAVEFQCYALKDANGNDTNYIKLRDIASILNGTDVQFEVGWNGAVNIETGKAYTPNGSEMSTPFSGNRAYENATAPTNINGQTAALEAIMLKDDKGGAYTYYKLRDLGASLGFKVDWSAEKGIFIETK